MSSDDYYKILELSKDASDKDISKAYKKMAIKWHPDKNQDKKEEAEEQFKKIGEAYEVLKDTRKRQIYDQVGKKGLQNSSNGEAHFHNSNPHDIFRSFFQSDDIDDIFQQHSHVFQMGNNIFTIGGSSPHIFKSHSVFTRNNTAKQEQNQYVLLCHLQNSNYNGKIGKVDSINSNKYIITLINTHNKISIKKQNLILVVRCKIININTKKELNNKIGYICKIDETKNKYNVLIDNNSYLLNHNNIRIIDKIKIKIIGLESHKEFNNHIGSIFKIEDDKYSIIINNLNKQIKIKHENCIPILS